MDEDPRRAAILDAATHVFLRYGYKKTSMDDLARAAGLSRQGLYLHFPTKEALFKEGLLRMMAQVRAAGRAALAREEASLEDRLVDMFTAVHARLIGPAAEHLNELMLAAQEQLGPVVAELEQEQLADLARALRCANAWKGISAKELAEQLFATSSGFKHSTRTVEDYRGRMRTAVRIILRH